MFSTRDSLDPPSKMNSISKMGGRVLSIGLFCYLIAEITFSAVKFHDGRTAVSTTKHYEESRLMPSISLCFRNKFVNYGYNGSGVELGLNVTKWVKHAKLRFLIYYHHSILTGLKWLGSSHTNMLYKSTGDYCDYKKLIKCMHNLPSFSAKM